MPPVSPEKILSHQMDKTFFLSPQQPQDQNNEAASCNTVIMPIVNENTSSPSIVVASVASLQPFGDWSNRNVQGLELAVDVGSDSAGVDNNENNEYEEQQHSSSPVLLVTTAAATQGENDVFVEGQQIAAIGAEVHIPIDGSTTSRQKLSRRCSYEEMVHEDNADQGHDLQDENGDSVDEQHESLIKITQWALILQEVIHERSALAVPSSSKCLCPKAKAITQKLSVLAAQLDQEDQSGIDNETHSGIRITLDEVQSLLRAGVTIQVSRPSEAVIERANEVVKAAVAACSISAYVRSAIDSIAKFVNDLLNVPNCVHTSSTNLLDETDQISESTSSSIMGQEEEEDIRLGWGDLGCFGEPNRETPNLDKMAREGMTFTSFYTAAAICSPSRASLLTGRLPIRNGFYSNNTFGRNAYTPQIITGGIYDSEILLPEVLKKGGYRTKLVGKWHLGHRAQFHPLKHGFDEWFGAPNCHFKYGGKKGPNIPVYKNKDMIGRYYEDFPIDTKAGLSNYTQILTSEALKFIGKRAQTGKPFFLYFAPDSTHAPSYASSKFRGASKRGTQYGDAVMELDDSIGRILKWVKELGIANRTLVIFTSDNGAALVSRQHAGSNGPLLCGKQTTFEGGFRVPTIAWWPKAIRKRSVSTKPASQMDLYTTLISLAGQSIPKDRIIDGTDISGTLLKSKEVDDDKDSKNKGIFFYRGDLLMAVRSGAYKMHLWTWTTPDNELKHGIDHCPDIEIRNVTTTVQVNHTDHPVLYNIERDPGERFPINHGSVLYAAQVKVLREIVADHQNSLVKGEPALNWCDRAVMNWSPPGCSAIGDCLKPPESKPYLCDWPH